MKHAIQKSCFVGVLVIPLLFFAHLLSQSSDSSRDVLSDQVTYITRGDLSPANAAYIISRSGVYKLTSAKTASGVPNISITANNVVLDLGGNTLTGGTNGLEVTGNNVTVKNGTVTGATQSGVFVQATGFNLNNCDIVSSPTGITLQNSYQCVIEHCRVRNATQAGVELQSSWTSVVSECEVAGVSGFASEYGVLAQSGGNNSIEQCTVRAVRTSSFTGTDKVVGIVLSGETASRVNGNEVQAIESLTTVSAYGLWVNSGNNATVTNNSVTLVTTSNGRGQGVFVNQANSYVASNLCYDCAFSFTGVPDTFITSQANDRGVYNIDTNLTTPDQVEEIHSNQLPTIESQVDGLSAPFMLLESTVDLLSGCAEIPVRTPGTLSASGSYCLVDTLNGTLAITGTDITVCMNEHTLNGGRLTISGDRVFVANGTVRNNVSASGVYVTGNNCFLNNIRSIANRTGFEVAGAQNNQLMNCTAIGCTREGFLLQNCTRTELADCAVQSLVGTGTLAGIKTVNGTSNVFDGCSVDGVAATNGDAYGIWGVTEQKSIFTGNNVNDVSVTGGSAKGLALDENMWLQNALSFQASYSTMLASSIRTLDWLRVKPGLAYLICADENAASTLRIFRFAGEDSFDLVFEQNFTGVVDSASWFQAFGNTYALVVRQATAATDILTYLFDVTTESLLPLPNALYNYDTTAQPHDAQALNYEGDVYVAVSGDSFSGTETKILSFDGYQFNLVVGQEEGATVVRLDWYVTGTRVFLAVGRTSNPQVKVYEFFPQSSSVLVARGSYSSGNSVDGLSWLKYGDASYLACGISGVSPSINVLSFNPDAGTPLNLVASIVGRTWSADPDWLVSGTTIYLADPERQASTTNNVRILQFDPVANTLTAFRDIPLTTNAIAISTAWYTGVQGRAYLAAGLGNVAANKVTLALYGLDLIGSTTSVMQNNTVSNVSGSGIAVNELSNPVLSNSVYSAITPYVPWAPYRFDPSNEIVSGY